VHQFQNSTKQAGGLFYFCCCRQASRPRCDRRVRLATTTTVGLSSGGLQQSFGAQSRGEAALDQLQNADVAAPKAILFHPQSETILDAFMIA